MKTERICCVCCQPILGNYYKIDGVRFWCIACGGQWLRDAHPGYEARRARVAGALSGVDQSKIEAKERINGRK
jgi:hypothetical protein